MTEPTKTIRFKTDCRVEDERRGTPEEERYNAGQVVSLPASSADHWISRGKADDTAFDPKPAKVAAPGAKAAAGGKPKTSGGTKSKRAAKKA